MMRSEYRKALALGAVTGFALPMFAAPAAATPPRDWPSSPTSAPAAQLASEAMEAPTRTLVRESRSLAGKTYQVRPGDTLWAIAERQLGDPTRWPEIFEANRSKLSSPHLIRPSQRLVLGEIRQASRSEGSRSGATYTVQPGDTLGKIAQARLGKASDWPVLYALNRSQLASPHAIRPGQVLRVKGRTTVVVAPRAKVKRASSSLARKHDDGRLLKGHRRIAGSYYARSADGHLIWADTQERVHPGDSTLKTALAPKIREAFKVAEPKPVSKAVAKPAAAKPAAVAKPAKPQPVVKVMPEIVSKPPAQAPIVLPASQKPSFLAPTQGDRLAAGALSLVVPGAGQLYNGDPLRGALFAGAGALGLGATVYGVAQDRQDIGVAASAGLVVLSLWSATDAYLNAPARASAHSRTSSK